MKYAVVNVAQHGIVGRSSIKTWILELALVVSILGELFIFSEPQGMCWGMLGYSNK